ncbi:acyl-protein thioesterase 1 [Ramicandelaber brevisporus]|nr:acyl-protein thioesterase 1 [Ramicandelaber brevisporus]
MSPLTAVVAQARSRHTATVIFMHGLGDSGHGWADLSSAFQRRMPYCKFVYPNAPSMPVTINMGMRMPAWYDIATLNDLDHQFDTRGAGASAVKIDALVESEVKAGIPSERIVLGGFSQGGALTLYTALTTERKFAGLVALSSYLPPDAKLLAEPAQANKDTPIFMAHGDEDMVVQYPYGKKSYEKLKEMGYKAEFNTYEGMPHSSCQQEMADLLGFLVKQLPEQQA